MRTAIAIVGMACRYPDARSPRELWQTVLARRRAFRRFPKERLCLSDYTPRAVDDPDSIDPIEVALLENYSFDRGRFRVPAETYAAADLAHWLTLEVASEALADAGFADGANLPRDATGVVIGNSLTGEFSRAGLMRYRWPYVRRVLARTLADGGVDPTRVTSLLERTEIAYKAPFQPPNEESLAGGLSNTIAGRICNHFDLHGGGFTVDGACAASLLAVITACSRLTNGEIDVAVAGAVDLSLDPFELVGFARNGALARGEMRVFDQRSNGFWPGEGCGVVVLMRRQDALAQRRRIYASIRGWGISTDGQGGLTRPTERGQALALARAYQMARFGSDSISYFECHGTGTAVGDPIELAAITSVRRMDGAVAPAAVGSIKANIGHTKAAAGLAGLIKTTLVLSERVIPPMTACDRPHAAFAANGSLVEAPMEGRAWPRERPLRAGVSAMGFGGINTHLVLEGEGRRPRRPLTPDTRRLLASSQDAELFLLSAPNRLALLNRVESLAGRAEELSRADLADAAAALAIQCGAGYWRAAVLATSPGDLANRLARLIALLRTETERMLDVADGVFLARRQRAPRLAYLFPGQAAPAHLDGGAWRRRFNEVNRIYARAMLTDAGDGIATEVAQPAIVTASLAGVEMLRRLGLRARVAVGHSLGELTALAWAGAIDSNALLRLVRARGQAMGERARPGAMAAISGTAAEVEMLLDGVEANLACFNRPAEQVVAGTTAAIEAVLTRAEVAGVTAQRLSVSHAFHSPLMAPSLEPFARALVELSFATPRGRILSTVTGEALDSTTDLRAHLCAQILAPVRFAEAAAVVATEADLLIEVGPGRGLTRLIDGLTETPIIALDAGGPSLVGLLSAAGAAFVLGAPLRVSTLFADRFNRPIDLDRPRRFLSNPCESAQHMAAEPALEPPGATDARPNRRDFTVRARTNLPADTSPLEILRHLIAQRLDLPIATVSAEHRLLGDLHFNSISVSQLVAEAARALDIDPLMAPAELANATVGEVAEAIASIPLAMAGRRAEPGMPPGIDSWVRPFVITHSEKALVPRDAVRNIHWHVMSPDDHPMRDAVMAACIKPASETGGKGVIVLIPPEPEPKHAGLLLAAAREALLQCAHFLLIQHGGGGGALARCLSLEAPKLSVVVCDLPLGVPGAEQWAFAEANAAGPGYTEAHYDADGRRNVPRICSLEEQPADDFVLGPEDVLLVSGGGKGIGAECALALAAGRGVRIAVLGRSPADEPSLAVNLARISAAGLDLRYVQADVTDPVAVATAVAHIEAELGPVTALLHAAGINQPEGLATLSEETLLATLRVKWHGARNLLAAIDSAHLRLLVGFGSIIARTGLHGEAHYGLANEWLTRLIEDYAQAHPRCRCLALEWSVWAGIGMGDRLAALEVLSRQGVTALSIDQGAAMMRRLAAQSLPAPSVIVAGRFGRPPTVWLDGPSLPLLRFLETPRVYYPGIELVADSILSSDTDPYLADHALGGVSLLPAVMALEAIAEAAEAVIGAERLQHFEKVEFREAILVPFGVKTTLRVAALVGAPGRVALALRSSMTGFQIDHVRAVACFDVAVDAAIDDNLAALTRLGAAGEPLDVNPAHELYDQILFQRGRFQRLGAYRWLNARECVAVLAPSDGRPWYSAFLPQKLLLGDPGARDAGLHALQACIPHKRVIPVAVERIEIGLLNAATSYRAVARERQHEGDCFLYDLEFLDAGGDVVERWRGLTLRAIETLPAPEAWPVALLAPYLERSLEEFLPKSRIRLGVVNGKTDERGARRRIALALIGVDPEVVFTRPDGKPQPAKHNGATIHVSLTHAADITLAVAAPIEVTCDVEPIEPRGVAWRDLLSDERFSLAELLAKRNAEDFDASATRVWAAIECLRKAELAPAVPLLLNQLHNNGWIMLASGANVIVSFVQKIGSSGRPMAGAVLVAGVDDARDGQIKATQ